MKIINIINILPYFVLESEDSECRALRVAKNGIVGAWPNVSGTSSRGPGCAIHLFPFVPPSRKRTGGAGSNNVRSCKIE